MLKPSWYELHTLHLQRPLLKVDSWPQGTSGVPSSLFWTSFRHTLSLKGRKYEWFPRSASRRAGQPGALGHFLYFPENCCFFFLLLWDSADKVRKVWVHQQGHFEVAMRVCLLCLLMLLMDNFESVVGNTQVSPLLRLTWTNSSTVHLQSLGINTDPRPQPYRPWELSH